MRVSEHGFILESEDVVPVIFDAPPEFDGFGFPVVHGGINDALKNSFDRLRSDEDVYALMNRIEDKFLVPKSNLTRLISGLEQNLKLGDIDTDVRFNRNQTIYLDNKDCSLFVDCVYKKKPRIKLRIRSYAPNMGEYEDISYVEFKIKEEDGMVNKVRVRIPAQWKPVIAEGCGIPFTEDLVNLNKDISRSDLKIRLDAINSAIVFMGLREQIAVEYERRAYSGKNVRVTVDDSLEAILLRTMDSSVLDSLLLSTEFSEMRSELCKFTDKMIIVEVKHHDDFPQWISDLLESCGAERIKYSKYCGAMLALMESL